MRNTRNSKRNNRNNTHNNRNNTHNTCNRCHDRNSTRRRNKILALLKIISSRP
jgi:cytochrome c553